MTEWDVLLRALAAIVAGGAIGLERAYRGRAAGLRTNALVGFGAALAVAASEYGGGWTGRGSGDPTRVIQGIVTGIGFLGAGVIVKEGFSVRGLTTAASVWVVAAIGVLFGTGLFGAGAGATVVAWAALELLRRIENRVPVHAMVHCEIGYRRDAVPHDADLVALVAHHGFRVTEVAWRLDPASQLIEFELSMWSTAQDAMRALERALREDPQVASFRITPARD
jgi:putative Mg2+ transporter-C (MgtC) family protein